MGPGVMKKRSLLHIGVIFVLSLHASTAWSGTRFLVHQGLLGQCKKGDVTTLARGCANLWNVAPGTGDFLPWRDDSSHGDGRYAVLQMDCGEVEVLDVLPVENLAKVRCTGGLFPENFPKENFINLDALKCTPENLKVFGPSDGDCDCDLPSGAVSRQPALRELRSAKQNVADSSNPLIWELFENAQVIKGQVEANVANDQATMTKLYSRASEEKVGERIEAGVTKIDQLYEQMAKRFGADCQGSPKGMPSSDLVRGQRTCELVKSARSVAWDLLNQKTEIPLSRRVDEMLKGKVRLGVPGEQADRALGLRMLLLQGLPVSEQEKLQKSGELKFVRKSYEAGSNFYEVHGGYVFGGHRNKSSGDGYDCSDFIASVLKSMGSDTRIPGIPVAKDFRDMALWLKSPSAVELSKPNQDLASCFEDVELRKGEEPKAGDILVQQSPGGGHMVLVKSYDSRLGMVDTIEAAGGSKNSVIDHKRPIFEPTCRGSSRWEKNWNSRPVLPGLFALRFKAAPPPSCPIRVQ